MEELNNLIRLIIMAMGKWVGYSTASAVSVLGLAALYLIYNAPSLGVPLRLGMGIVVLILSGLVIRPALGLKGGYGFSMGGSKRGIGIIDRLSKSKGRYWEVMALWGLTLGFGIFAWPLVKGRIGKRTYAFGIASLVLIYLFVLPYSAYGFSLVNIPQLSGAAGQAPSASLLQMSPYRIAMLAITTVFGFSGLVFASIIYNSWNIIYSIAALLANPTAQGVVSSGITTQIPGVAPVIPGITIPLFAGIGALAILLIVHEFSHGVLARRAGLKIKSVGILLFGFLPLGGFVEPDEKALRRLKPDKQTGIFSAGIAANFVAMIVFFVLTLAFATYVVPHAYHYGIFVSSTQPGYPANGILHNGMRVLKWNGMNVTNVSTLASAAASDRPNSTVDLLTSAGAYAFRAVPDPNNSSRGLIGVGLSYMPIRKGLYAGSVYFLFNLFSLSLLLNFLVAVVNLLPVPGLDGWRVYMANVRNTAITRYLGALIIVMLIVNALPWIPYFVYH